MASVPALSLAGNGRSGEEGLRLRGIDIVEQGFCVSARTRRRPFKRRRRLLIYLVPRKIGPPKKCEAGNVSVAREPIRCRYPNHTNSRPPPTMASGGEDEAVAALVAMGGGAAVGGSTRTTRTRRAPDTFGEEADEDAIIEAVATDAED